MRSRGLLFLVMCTPLALLVILIFYGCTDVAATTASENIDVREHLSVANRLMNTTRYEKESLVISACKSSTTLSFCNQSSLSHCPFSSYTLPDGADMTLCWGPVCSSMDEFFPLSKSSSHTGVEVMELVRKLSGNGAHRELKTSIRARLGDLDECHIVLVERIPSGIFADIFELEGLVARAVFKNAVIYGDHNLELPALHSSESMVVLHTMVRKRKSGHFLQAEISLPLHARYPPLSLESHIVVDLRFPYLLFKCSENGSDARTTENAWTLLTLKDSLALNLAELQWAVPAGNPRHAGIVAAITALFALAGVALLWIVSMYSNKRHKLKMI